MAVPTSDLMSELIIDLSAETAELREMVRVLDLPGWELPTPSEGWVIRDQISHLAWFDDAATSALTDPDGFRAARAELMARVESAMDDQVAAARGLAPAALLEWFDTARARMIRALRAVDPATRLPWYGPDMSPASFATARLMETWAHGQDVADTLGIDRAPTTRLRHVALLGVRAMPYGFAVRGRQAPARPVRVELAMPDGTLWVAGPEGAADVVRGPVRDFCLVVTQRSNVADTSLSVTGDIAREWMSIAQAYAGPPGPGREPGTRKTA
ncbi:TIGR03084 family metal-binding protein [Microtetraspora malaysiensis]|uniref:TIGR03084 family metal-binding protein n=1 Tax=Microtetraspora malaysiensis TaxID=161358 RepID=UPI003D938EAF